jgi:hypothetical protein
VRRLDSHPGGERYRYKPRNVLCAKGGTACMAKDNPRDRRARTHARNASRPVTLPFPQGLWDQKRREAPWFIRAELSHTFDAHDTCGAESWQNHKDFIFAMCLHKRMVNDHSVIHDEFDERFFRPSGFGGIDGRYITAEILVKWDGQAAFDKKVGE